ncbi:MAG: fibrobacter succinogenes major paralogous domain-containing protein [Rikenellaceae bacterium]|nr:fibrobacter succinogenes major paralogous domain-containing protein [Rikenellaceae bacterium]MDE7356382.1 fibrobacter succinogenes major paralogous domain-containing protein [Rikenellaceae bacterium]
MEFPAVGYRYYSDGTLTNAGAWGDYWSSVANGSSYAYNLYFSSSALTVGNGNLKRYGYSVRCVR